MTNVRVKPISELEVKSEVSADDKILILDSVSEEARLASKDELKGDKGDPGTPGAAATITVGTTSTGAAGTSASVTNSGTSSAAVFDFTIPKGDQGNPGQDGADGNGITSVTSSKVGKTTTVTMNFDEGDPFSFEVQDGADGVGGDGDVKGPDSSTNGHMAVFDGATGKAIRDGGIVPTGFAPGNTGTTGQVLKKTNSGYEWDDESGRGGSGDVTGPASSTDGHLAVFDGATGKLIKDGGALPTKTSDLNNDSGYITSSDIPEDISEFNNDAGYITSSYHDATKQDVLTAGTNIQISDNVISATGGGSDIVYATQAEYNALLPGALTDNKHYFIYEEEVGPTPGGWQPGVNTVVYYPLESDVNDYSGNNNDGTNNGVTFSNVGGVDCAVFTSASTKIGLPGFGNFTNLTVSAWIKTTASIQISQVVGIAPTSDNKNFSLSIYNGTATLSRYTGVSYNITDGTVNDGTWHHILGTYTSTGGTKLYVDGVYIDADATTTSVSSSSGYTFIGGHQSGQSMFAYVGNISNVILETVERTAQEVADYFDQTKGDYGIS